MKSKILFIILLVSLAFNVGFVVKYVHKVCSRQKTTIPAPQKRNMQTHRFAPNEEIVLARAENIQLRKQFFMELAMPEVNTDAVNELSIQLNESQIILEQAVLNHFVEIRQEMDTEEAESFFGRFGNRYEDGKERFTHKEKNRRQK